jgi:succinate-semialdehyde dehydrogenase/glutarate-semialdehyde dehydrogenase
MTTLRLNDSSLWRHQAFIDGEWSAADDGGTIDVLNPADGARLGSVPRMGGAETRRAIDAAYAAGPAWRMRLTSASSC